MFLKLAKVFKTWFIALTLTEVKAQSKKIRKSNEKVNEAYEAADRYAAEQASKRGVSAERIDEATRLRET